MESGSSRHMKNDSLVLTNLQETSVVVEIGEEYFAVAQGIGTLNATRVSDGVTTNFEPQNVTFVPYLTTNLLSVRCLQRKGLCVG